MHTALDEIFLQPRLQFELSQYGDVIRAAHGGGGLPQQHAVAGFGRIETIGADEMFPSADKMAALEEGAVAHMNDDHADAIQRYAEKLLGATPGGWKIEGMDPDGADLRRGEAEVLRLPFTQPVYSGGALRKLLADLGAQTQK